MIFCGIGESVVNTLLAVLNLPTIFPTTLKRREREARLTFEAVTNETCNKACRWGTFSRADNSMMMGGKLMEVVGTCQLIGFVLLKKICFQFILVLF